MHAHRPAFERMTVLVVHLPPRPREPTRDGSVRPTSADWPWLLLDGAGQAAASGRGAAAEWPAATSLVLVLAAQDVAWHRVALPKAPAGRLRQALLGVLEDHLLDDGDDLHFALAPEPVAGQPTWVAVTHRPWLAELLQRLEAGGRAVDRVLPTMAPSVPPTGHFEMATNEDGDRLQLTWADADGVLRLGPDGSLARARAATAVALDSAVWTAMPPAATAAEAWLGRPVTVLGTRDGSSCFAASINAVAAAGLACGSSALARSPSTAPALTGLAIWLIVPHSEQEG